MIYKRTIKRLFGFSSAALSSAWHHYCVSVQSEQRQQRRRGGGQRNGKKQPSFSTLLVAQGCCRRAPPAKATGSRVAYGHHIPHDVQVQVQDYWEVKRHLPKQEMFVWKEWNCLGQQLFAKRICSTHTKCYGCV